MINLILEFSLRQRVLILCATVGLIVAGLWSAQRLPIDAVPDITGVQIQVNTTVPALAADESEKLVTQPLENELAGLQGVEEMRSETKYGLSQITLRFEDGTDIYRARQLATERLQTALEKLPAGVQPKLAPISTGLGEIYYYTLGYTAEAKNKPADELAQLMELSALQEYFIKPRLRTLPGIAEINGTGGYEKQIVIQPRLDALAAHGISFNDLADMISQNVNNAGGGIIERGREQLSVRLVSRINTLPEIANLPLKFGAAARPFLVKDVADVTIGTKFRTGAATLNGHETVLGSTLMLTGANGREVAQRVKERLAEIQEQLPPGVRISPEYDRSDLINRTIHTVEKNLFEGALLVIVILFALLGNWRAALIVSAAIPLSFLFALIGMNRFGISGNLMSLGAVDFGLIIDGAVVMVENIVRQLSHRQQTLGRLLTAEERTKTVLAAGRQVGRPMFFGVLIITVVYLPILTLSGIEGKMFHPMALTVMLALGGALVLALTLMPVLCSLFLTREIQEEDNAVVRVSKRLYAPLLEFALNQRSVVMGATVLLLVGTAFVFTRLGAEFVPKLDEGSLTLMYQKNSGISMVESLRSELEAEKLLLSKFPQIRRIFSRVGTSEVATDPMPPNESDIYIEYHPIEQWPKTTGRPTTKAELGEKIDTLLKDKYPDFSVLVAQPIEMRFNEMLEGTRAELALKIYGNEDGPLTALAEQIKELLEKLPGTREVEFGAEGLMPQLVLKAQRDVLQRYNLPASALNQAVEAALAGQTAGLITEGNRRTEIVVRLPESVRGDEAQIQKIPVRVGDGGFLPLGDLVTIETVRSREPIVRENGQRMTSLSINLSTSDMEGYVKTATQLLHEKVTLPDGYTMEFGGTFKNLQQARARLALVVPAALLLIFGLIFFALGSVRQTLLVSSGVPLALTGGVLALALRGMPFSITAAVGFIALSGVAVLNGLMLITSFNQLREEGLAVLEAVHEGVMTRLRPVLMTALVASLGFVPMALATGGGAEVQRPLATVVIGGILSSTFLTLVLLPVLYVWAESRRKMSNLS
jgi:cobalt-zinc-cadmium resistance protein CzcA